MRAYSTPKIVKLPHAPTGEKLPREEIQQCKQIASCFITSRSFQYTSCFVLFVRNQRSSLSHCNQFFSKRIVWLELLSLDLKWWKTNTNRVWKREVKICHKFFLSGVRIFFFFFFIYSQEELLE